MDIFYQIVSFFLVEKENITYCGNNVFTYISINKYIQLLTNTTHKILIHICYKMLKAWDNLYINKYLWNRIVCMYIYSKIMTQAMVNSSCKKWYNSVHNEKPKVDLKHAKIVERREEVKKTTTSINTK